jgi:hypothetical protein
MQGDIVESAQTAALLVIAGALLWGMSLVRREIRQAGVALAAVRRGQKAIQDEAAETKKRIERLEKR